MRINTALFEMFEARARETEIAHVCLGLGYSVIITSDGGAGIAYTWLDSKDACMVQKGFENPEGRPAIDVLEYILSETPVERTMALALINALNYHSARTLAEQSDNTDLLDLLGVGKGTRVAMVGAFKPLIRMIKQRQGIVEVLDMGRQIGDEGRFYENLAEWPDVLMITSTSLLNNTTEAILENAKKGIPVVMLGPSTPLVGAPFRPLGVSCLAGTVPIDIDGTCRAVRHGTGTPVIQKFGRKVLLRVNSSFA
ncbi:MAG: DUF364 domain-containing protein [Thermodesulfobacteriota bacterium]|nr:DUF364 domain-containing protein [Thermodesulfobacteriota bacterium]